MSRRVSNYTLVTAFSEDNLELAVKQLIRNGWELHGQPFVKPRGDGYNQDMVKYEEPKIVIKTSHPYCECGKNKPHEECDGSCEG